MVLFQIQDFCPGRLSLPFATFTGCYAGSFISTVVTQTTLQQPYRKEVITMLLTQCAYSNMHPPQERLCGDCPDFLNICISTRCTESGLMLGVECDLLMCEACGQNCIYRQINL